MATKILNGDCREVLKTLPDKSVHCCVTSPPYFGLRDYGHAGQIGREATPDAFVAEMVAVFREVRRVLRDDGTLWLNLGDSYCSTDKWGGGGNLGKNTVAPDGTVPSWAVRTKKQEMPGVKPKDLIGIPWRVAFALQADGWYLRQDIIWSKPNPMPESVTDRCTKAHEYVFLLSKGPRYYYDTEAIKEPAMGGGAQKTLDGSKANLSRKYRGHLPGNKTHRGLTAYNEGDGKHRTKAGLVDYSTKVNADPSLMLMRNRRSVWTVPTQPFKGAHFAVFPSNLIEPCIKAGCPKGGTVLDPFGGAGTSGLVADRLGRDAILIELNPEYAAMAERRIKAAGGGVGRGEGRYTKTFRRH